MSLSPQSPDNTEPVFRTPWEARAFAIVNQLAADHHYNWAEWTEYLSQEISATEQVVPASKTYYENWLTACEKLLIAKGLIVPQEIDRKIAQLSAADGAEHQH